MAIESRNPATGEVEKVFEPFDGSRVEAAVAAAEVTFSQWRLRPVTERAGLLARAADILDERRASLAELATREMGKTLKSARAEVEKCALVCRYYAEHAEAYLAPEAVETDASRAFVAYQPLGVVLAVMPWNFPFWQVFRFAAPALAAGNVALLKHASNVPQCALAIEAVLHDAGFPEGAFTTLLIGSEAVAPLLQDARVAAVSLTGSDVAGAQVAAAAGRALKKCVLELGGSDPFVVMPSADLDAATQTGVQARMINNGQSCIAAKRFIVHEAVYDAFRERFVAGVKGLAVGDPMQEAVDIGPLATESIRDGVARQVEASVAAGAQVLTGGQRIGNRGYYFAPTVLADIPAAAPAFDEEVFGPVASLYRVADIDAAIDLANATPFGLGASVWTTREDEQQRFVRDVAAGSVFVNRMVASDPRLPFGGVKRSGYGRELARHGILEFVNIKTVSIA